MRKSAIAWFVLAVLLAASAHAGLSFDVPVDAKKILIKDKANAAKRRVVLLLKDGAIDPTNVDPTVSGATLYLVDPFPGQQSSVFAMPATGWQSKKNKFKYKDKDLVEGPVKSALLKEGLLRLVLKGGAIDFPVLGVAPLDEVGGVVGVGATRFCFLFPGTTGTVKKDDAAKGIYKAIDADAPPFCPGIIN